MCIRDSNELAQFMQVLGHTEASRFSASRLKDYLQYCHETLQLSENTLHSRINALKFYYEQVLGKEKFFWEIPRPKTVSYTHLDVYKRQIRYQDVYDLKKIIRTELNIEGNPTEEKFVQLVLANQPAQVTLVPDALGQVTSNHGWNTIAHQDYLKNIITVFKTAGIRVSIFVDPVPEMVEAAASTGTDLSLIHILSELRSGFRGFVAAFFDFPGVFKAFSLLKTQYGQAFQIPREADQRPFATDFRQAAQRELTKSHDRCV